MWSRWAAILLCAGIVVAPSCKSENAASVRAQKAESSPLGSAAKWRAPSVLTLRKIQGGDGHCWFSDDHTVNLVLRSTNLQHGPDRPLGDFEEIARLSSAEFHELGVWVTQETHHDIRNCENDPVGDNPMYCFERAVNSAFGITTARSVTKNDSSYDNWFVGDGYDLSGETIIGGDIAGFDKTRLLRVRLRDLRAGGLTIRVYNVHAYHQCDVNAATQRKLAVEAVIKDLNDFSPKGQELPSIFAGDFNLRVPAVAGKGCSGEAGTIDENTRELLSQNFVHVSKPKWASDKDDACRISYPWPGVDIDHVYIARSDRFRFNGTIDATYLKYSDSSPDTAYCRKRREDCSPTSQSPHCLSCLTDHSLLTMGFKVTCVPSCPSDGCGRLDGCGSPCPCDTDPRQDCIDNCNAEAARCRASCTTQACRQRCLDLGVDCVNACG